MPNSGLGVKELTFSGGVGIGLTCNGFGDAAFKLFNKECAHLELTVTVGRETVVLVVEGGRVVVDVVLTDERVIKTEFFPGDWAGVVVLLTGDWVGARFVFAGDAAGSGFILNGKRIDIEFILIGGREVKILGFVEQENIELILNGVLTVIAGGWVGG